MVSDLPFLACSSASFLVLLLSAAAGPATRHARPTRSTQVTQQRFMAILPKRWMVLRTQRRAHQKRVCEGKCEMANGKRKMAKGQANICHFPFSICHFPCF